MRHFAEHGYRGARIESIAQELGIAKGSVFQHFGSKSGLFFEAYTRAVTSLPAWLDAPPEVLADGFFATVRYWLDRTEHLVKQDWVPYRVSLVGNYCSDLSLKRDINRFLVSEDPYGTLEFVEWGQAPGRGAKRCRRRADGLDGRLALRLGPGRPRHRGAGPRTLPPLARPARPPLEPASSSSRRSFEARSRASPERNGNGWPKPGRAASKTAAFPGVARTSAGNIPMKNPFVGLDPHSCPEEVATQISLR